MPISISPQSHKQPVRFGTIYKKLEEPPTDAELKRVATSDKTPKEDIWQKSQEVSGTKEYFAATGPHKEYFEGLEAENKLSEVFQFLKDFADYCEQFPGQKIDKQTKTNPMTITEEDEGEA